VAASTKAKYLIFFMIFNFFTYFGLQYLITHNEYSFLTSMDAQIPMVPSFIWIYHTLIPVICVSMYSLIVKREVFMTAFTAFLVATIVLSLCYIFFPSFYPRPPLQPETISESLLVLTRSVDGAHNTFPSGHVTFAWLLFFSMGLSTQAHKSRWTRHVYFFWAALISISTLVLKQHYILDVFAGIILAAASFYLAKYFIFQRRLLTSQN
tara:strand:+ start:3206 stop:3832 length:627 start_codon:yes stop_codon:yes gene_type:complete